IKKQHADTLQLFAAEQPQEVSLEDLLKPIREERVAKEKELAEFDQKLQKLQQNAQDNRQETREFQKEWTAYIIARGKALEQESHLLNQRCLAVLQEIQSISSLLTPEHQQELIKTLARLEV